MTIRSKRNHLMIVLIAFQFFGKVNAESTVRQYHIPAQSLNSALMGFASDSNLELLYSADQLRGLNFKGLDGTMTPKQALDQLLQDSGYTYRFIDDHTVTLEKAPPPPASLLNSTDPTNLPKVNVVGNAVYDVKDPYNEDYVIPNATAGTKTDTPIMETPLNVQVVSKQVMKDQQVISLGDALKNVSGVVFNSQTSVGNLNATNAGTDSIITLRGFASTTTLRNGFRLQGGANRNMSNVESVEVLKGPAAILYGLVEPGGMVNVVTKQPLATPYYALNQQFGSYDNYRTTIDTTGPVAGNTDVLYRMNVSYQNSGSYQNYVSNEDIFLAPTLKWVISPKTQLTAEFEYNRQNKNVGNAFNPYLGGQLMNLPLSTNYGAVSPTVTETFFGNLNWSHQFNDDWSVKHSFSVNQQGFTANGVALPGVTTTSAGFVSIGLPPQPFVGWGVVRTPIGNGSQSDTYSTNLDLIGHFNTYGLRHTTLFGGDYYRLNNSFSMIRSSLEIPWSVVNPYNPVNPGLQLDPNISASGDFGSHQQTDQYGLYGQDQIKLPFDVHITGGIRYQYIHQRTLTTGDGGVSTGDTAYSQDAVTPRVGVLWHPQSWVSLYANYAESFGPNTGLTWIGSGQTTAGQYKQIAPTSAEQYEGGIKTEFLDGQLRATLAYYDMTKTNVATGDPQHPFPACGSGCSLAIGGIRSRGPELDIQGELFPGWNMIATWANTDIRVSKTNANNDPLPLNNLSVGSRLFDVPRNTASVWSTYEIQDTDFKGLKFGGGVTVRDGTIGVGGLSFATGTNAPTIHVPAYATLDLMTAYSHSFGKSKVTVQFNLTNLLDKRYYTNINSVNNDTTNGFYAANAAYGAPRAAMGSINIQY
ncbi:TonB-dependent receptor [Methylomonas sp. AM2-LC]|uniref:TonB-dependent siderophore receptor n=1 Tax=Methylomonas sp. AM2-LC TaxID=3153301 RepID=UPI003264CAAC